MSRLGHRPPSSPARDLHDRRYDQKEDPEQMKQVQETHSTCLPHHLSIQHAGAPNGSRS